MPENLCGSCGAPGSPGAAGSPAEPRARLCPVCEARLRANLAALPGLHTACAGELVPGTRQLRERVSGWRPAGIVLQENAVTARSDSIAVLVSWASLVVDERRLEGRRVRGPRGQEASQLVAFLQRHFEWLAAHPAAGDFADEVAGMVSAMRDVLDPGAAASLAVSSCEQPGCSEPVLVRLGVRDPGRHPVSCTAGHRVPPERWLRLRPSLPAAGAVSGAARAAS